MLLTYAAAGLAGLASAQAGAFYQELKTPPWAPPGWLFGPVWSLLYTAMGVAVWLVWRARGNRSIRGAFILFALQLAANALWSWLFFAWRQGAWAALDILLLWGLILATIISFWRYSRWAAALLLPYLAWVSFATVLGITIWLMNPELL
jgi:benzodiazapine receptor